MAIEFLLDRLDSTKDAQALIWRSSPVLYGDLTQLVEFWQERLVKEGVPKGAVIALEADFSPNFVALLLSLLQHTCVVALLTAEMKSSRAELHSVAEVEWIITIELDDNVIIERTGRDRKEAAPPPTRHSPNVKLFFTSRISYIRTNY